MTPEQLREAEATLRKLCGQPNYVTAKDTLTLAVIDAYKAELEAATAVADDNESEDCEEARTVVRQAGIIDTLRAELAALREDARVMAAELLESSNRANVMYCEHHSYRPGFSHMEQTMRQVAARCLGRGSP